MKDARFSQPTASQYCFSGTKGVANTPLSFFGGAPPNLPLIKDALVRSKIQTHTSELNIKLPMLLPIVLPMLTQKEDRTPETA